MIFRRKKTDGFLKKPLKMKKLYFIKALAHKYVLRNK